MPDLYVRKGDEIVDRDTGTLVGFLFRPERSGEPWRGTIFRPDRVGGGSDSIKADTRWQLLREAETKIRELDHDKARQNYADNARRHAAARGVKKVRGAKT